MRFLCFWLYTHIWSAISALFVSTGSPIVIHRLCSNLHFYGYRKILIAPIETFGGEVVQPLLTTRKNTHKHFGVISFYGGGLCARVCVC